jgi:hypothetical protein
VGTWVTVGTLVVGCVLLVLWWRWTGEGGLRPLDGAWRRWSLSRIRDRLAVPGQRTKPADLVSLSRQVLEGVVRLGHRTMRDRTLLLPEQTVLHVHPDDAELVRTYLAVIERDVAAEIETTGPRLGWSAPAPLRIVDVVVDRNIAPGRPLVQRATAADSLRSVTRPHTTATRAVASVARLEPLDGGAGAAVPVPAGGGLIGRDPRRCTMVVTGPTVSREHAGLEPVGGGFRVRDLGSANGIKVNGVRVTEYVLRDGDILGLGRSVRFRLRVTSGTDEAVDHGDVDGAGRP